MTASIYDLHAKAFDNVSAYVVLNSAMERVATVAFRYPRDGAGRLWCYFHVIGIEMTRGYASGGGYDKHSAAAYTALSRVTGWEQCVASVAKMRGAIKDQGFRWDHDLREAGFTVLQAV